jgi:hypothetical protein
MANWGNCRECGREIVKPFSDGPNLYCSDGCRRKGKAAKQAAQTAGLAEQSANLGRVLKLVGIVFVALVAVLTMLFYKFPKFLAGKNKKFLYAYIGLWAVLVAGAVVYFAFFSPEAVSGIKTKIVSASCETQEEFVSILNEASSKDNASWTKIEGEEFTTYSGQARDVVKERESVLKEAVYLVRFPDSVNAYIWFNTEGKAASAYVYKIE